MITGPNDKSDVVWAISSCFFLFFRFFLLLYQLMFIVYIDCKLPNMRQRGTWKATTMNKGPNDADFVS